MSSHLEREEPESTSLLVGVGIVLLILAAISFGLSFLRLGAWETPVALGIGALKALGIALWFMELRHAPTVLRAVAVAGLALFVLLVSLTAADVATRIPAPMAVPGPGPGRQAGR